MERKLVHIYSLRREFRDYTHTYVDTLTTFSQLHLDFHKKLIAHRKKSL